MVHLPNYFMTDESKTTKRNGNTKTITTKTSVTTAYHKTALGFSVKVFVAKKSNEQRKKRKNNDNKYYTHKSS